MIANEDFQLGWNDYTDSRQPDYRANAKSDEWYRRGYNAAIVAAGNSTDDFLQERAPEDTRRRDALKQLSDALDEFKRATNNLAGAWADAALDGDEIANYPTDLGASFDEFALQVERMMMRDAEADADDPIVVWLEDEPVFRVVLNRSWGQTPRVTFIEATDVEDAVAGFKSDAARRAGVRVLQARRATAADAAKVER